MIQGFVANYIDNENYRHLYFFPGIDDNNNAIYNNIDLSKYDFKYEITTNIDGSIDYKFLDKHIIKITCKLYKFNNTFNLIVLNYK